MPLIKDIHGREHHVRVTVGTLAELRDKMGLLLAELAPTGRLSALDRLDADPVLLVDALRVICRSADPPEIWREAWSGDVLWVAWLALLESLTDFFPNPAGRARLRGHLEKDRMAGQSPPSRRATSLPGSAESPPPT